jgi:hypothetical protein
MRHPESTILLLAAALVACGDSTGPTESVTLSFCPGTVWAGVQSEGENWVTIANGPTDATIDASERLIVAVINPGGNDGKLTFYLLTRDQAQATFVCSTAGTKQLSGSVTGTSGSLTQIAMANSTAGTGTLFTNFTLTNLPDGPLDLVATHRNTAIIRRRVNYANGATIPALDFSSAEAFALQAHTLTIELNGIVAPQWTTAIMTNGGTRANLSSSGPPCCTDGKIYTQPASRQESGDLYHLTVGGGGGGDGRLVERFYATPSDQTLVFGPPASRATLTTVATAGQLWRAEIPAQPEYGSQIELAVGAPQPSTNTTSVVIRASREYFGGTPTTWAFTVPDLSSVAGFPSGWPSISVPGGWQFSASDAPWGFSASSARAGDIHRSATAR